MKVFYHVSNNELQLGAVLVSGKSINRPHLTFFCDITDSYFRRLDPYEKVDFMARRKVESIFEECREQLNVSCGGFDISRRNAIFASEDIRNAERWRKQGAYRCGGKIYGLVADNSNGNLKTHKSDTYWYNYAVRVAKLSPSDSLFGALVFRNKSPEAEISFVASKYWQSEPFYNYVRSPEYEDPRWEILLEGKVVVQSVVDFTNQKPKNVV